MTTVNEQQYDDQRTALIERYEALISKADQYHKRALWQEKLRALHELKEICENEQLPNSSSRKQDVLFDLGAVRRRLGQYNKAEEVLEEALRAGSEPLKRAYIFGELAVVLRSSTRIEESLNACNQQYQLAQEVEPCLEAEIEQCRAIGNAGMCVYNLASTLPDGDNKTNLLLKAEQQILERIERSQKLQSSLKSTPESKWVAISRAWETIGLDRLSLVYIEQGRISDGLQAARSSQSKQTNLEPTITAFSKYFYGNALWHNGEKDAALKQWSAQSGICSSPIALSKESSKEHNSYLRQMAEAGVDFDTFDEQGFTALDYAVLSQNSDSSEAVDIILVALKNAFDQQSRIKNTDCDEAQHELAVDDLITTRRRQAEVRRQYRNLFQESLRPKLQAVHASHAARRSTIRELRSIYKDFLADSSEKQYLLWPFHYVKYDEFKKNGRVPIYGDGLTRSDSADTSDIIESTNDFVIFLSYRWRGGSVPDVASNMQWRRMVDAVEQYLTTNSHLRQEDIAIWVDYACIDQDDLPNKLRGVDSLPVAVTLCDVMISLVDDTYYERAWCGVEVMLLDSLASSYAIHQRLEHVENADGSTLRTVTTGKALPIDQLKLTNEVEDRPKIDFLMRQSRLIGRDLV